MKRTVLLLAVGALVVFGALRYSSSFKPLDRGGSAPDFTAVGSDGSEYSLSSLTADQPLVLYFISNSCPVNANAVEYFNQVSEAYEGKVNFVGVIDADLKKFEKWNDIHNVPFPVLLDPRNEIINSYGASASPWVIAVDQEKSIDRVFRGYSKESLQTLSDLIASYSNEEAVVIDTKGAPISLSYG